MSKLRRDLIKPIKFFVITWVVIACLVSITIGFFYSISTHPIVFNTIKLIPITSPGRISIKGYLNDSLGIKVIKQLERFEDDTTCDGIVIYINSQGGSGPYMFLICEAIEYCKKPVATVVVGQAFSAAGTILICGDRGRRYATSGSEIMIHKGLYRFDKIVLTEEDLEFLLESLKNSNEKEYQLLAGHTPHSAKQIEGLIEKDLYLTPEEALGFGMIDGIKP